MRFNIRTNHERMLFVSQQTVAAVKCYELRSVMRSSQAIEASKGGLRSRGGVLPPAGRGVLKDASNPGRLSRMASGSSCVWSRLCDG